MKTGQGSRDLLAKIDRDIEFLDGLRRDLIELRLALGGSPPAPVGRRKDDTPVSHRSLGEQIADDIEGFEDECEENGDVPWKTSRSEPDYGAVYRDIMNEDKRRRRKGIG